MFSELKLKSCLLVLLGSFLLAFGLYNVHALSGVTEGGGLGLILLLNHWFGISPAISSFIFNIACYVLGWRIMGRKFIYYSIISSIGFSIFYAVDEMFPPFWPEIGQHPLVAALVGALFVGVGCGLCVRVGGAPGGDDALAMSFSKVLKVKIQWVYLFSDLIVLVLSATYIPLPRLGFSLLTVLLSGQIIGFIQNVKLPAWLGSPAEAE